MPVLNPSYTGGGGGTYVLPPATADTLGGIKASDTVIVEADGTATIVLPDSEFATDEEVAAALDAIFGPQAP